MRLKDLPDWTSPFTPLSPLSIIKNVKRSHLGHLIVLEIEHQGVHDFKMIGVGSKKIEKILSVMEAYSGPSLSEIAQLEIGD